MPLLDGLTGDPEILGVDPEEVARRAALRPGTRAYNLALGATSQPVIPDKPILGSLGEPPPILGNPGNLPSMDTGGGILGKPTQPAAPPPTFTPPARSTPAADAYENLRTQGSPWQREGKLGKFLDILGTATRPGRAIETATGLGSLGYQATLGRAKEAADEEGGLAKAAEESKAAVARTAETEAQTGKIKAETEELQNRPDTPNDKKIDEYVNDQGQRVLTFQKADGSTYDKVGGKTLQKEKPDTATAMDEKYDALRAKQSRGGALTQEESSFLKSYRERKTMAPAAGATIRVEGAVNQERIKKADDEYQKSQDADARLSRMEGSYKKALKGDQQAMLALLTDHIGMTLGLQKGARITKDILTEAQQSQPWLAKIESKFDDRGLLSGVTLGPEQMKQMLDLGYDARNRQWDTAFSSSQLYGEKEPPGARSVYSKRDPSARVYNEQGSGQQFSVSVGGKTYTFKDQQSLDNFKREARIK